MNKKTIAFITLIFSTFFLFYFFILASTQKKMNDYLVVEEDYSEIINTRSINNKLDADIFFDGHRLIKDNNNYLYYSLIENRASSYNPNVSIDDDYNIAIRGCLLNDELIKCNIHFNVLVYSSDEYKEYELVFTTLPILCFDTKNNEQITEEDIDGNLYLFDNRENIKRREIESNALFHIRGSSSKQFDKKPYKISLISNQNEKNKIELLGLRYSDEYILNAMYTDKEKIREVFSSNLWYESCANNNSLGITNGFKYEYVELLINGEYQGLYALGFKPDKDVFNIEQKDWCYRKISAVSSEFKVDLENTDYVEGYEIKYNHQGYDYWDVLKDYIRTMRATNQNNYDKLIEQTEINNSIDYYLFINLVQGIDNWIEETNSLNNMYLTYKNSNGRFLYTPWDLDRTWGMGRTGIDYYDDPSVNVISKATAADILLKYSINFKDDIKRRYYDLRKNEWSNESITRIIKRYESNIFFSGAFNRDNEKWPDKQHYMSKHINESEGLSSFLEYVLKRLEYMDEYINGI